MNIWDFGSRAIIVLRNKGKCDKETWFRTPNLGWAPPRWRTPSCCRNGGCFPWVWRDGAAQGQTHPRQCAEGCSHTLQKLQDKLVNFSIREWLPHLTTSTGFRELLGFCTGPVCLNWNKGGQRSLSLLLPCPSCSFKISDVLYWAFFCGSWHVF